MIRFYFLLFKLGIMGNNAQAAEHKASAFLSETADFYPLVLGDPIQNMQIDQHPQHPIGILFSVASNVGSSYKISRNKTVLSKGVFEQNGMGGTVEFAAAYIETSDFCSKILIEVLDSNGKTISTSTLYFQCAE
jgi:hypothetical protein